MKIIKPQYENKCKDLGENTFRFDVTTYYPDKEDFANVIFNNSHIKMFSMLFYKKHIELVGFNTFNTLELGETDEKSWSS